MAQSSPSSETSAQHHYSIQFVQRCAAEFQWKDLSEDIVMVIGCGDELNCCKAIMMQFPEVKALIVVDHENTVFQKAQFSHGRILFCVGDIRERDSLKSYEGKMDKVISTNTFHQILEKEMAFRNVYRILKPGGEAGFFFCVNSCMYKFLTVLSEIPKYGAIMETHDRTMMQNVWNEFPLGRVLRTGCMNLETFASNLYPPEDGEQYYKQLLEKIGFKDVRATEKEKRLPFDTEEDFEENFIEDVMDNLEISREDAETFKAEVVEILEKTFGRYEGKRCYVSVHLNLFGVKPMESSDLKSKETTVA